MVSLYAYSANNISQLYDGRNTVYSVNQPCGPYSLSLSLFQDVRGGKLKYHSHFQGVWIAVPSSGDICCLSAGADAGSCQPSCLAWLRMGPSSGSEGVGREADVS